MGVQIPHFYYLKQINLLNESNSNKKLKALHINHQTQSKSDKWEIHCKKFCEQNKINFQAEKINIDIKGEGFEAAARSARLVII